MLLWQLWKYRNNDHIRSGQKWSGRKPKVVFSTSLTMKIQIPMLLLSLMIRFNFVQTKVPNIRFTMNSKRQKKVTFTPVNRFIIKGIWSWMLRYYEYNFRILHTFCKNVREPGSLISQLCIYYMLWHTNQLKIL